MSPGSGVHANCTCCRAWRLVEQPTYFDIPELEWPAKQEEAARKLVEITPQSRRLPPKPTPRLVAKGCTSQ